MHNFNICLLLTSFISCIFLLLFFKIFCSSIAISFVLLKIFCFLFYFLFVFFVEFRLLFCCEHILYYEMYNVKLHVFMLNTHKSRCFQRFRFSQFLYFMFIFLCIPCSCNVFIFHYKTVTSFLRFCCLIPNLSHNMEI